MQKESIGGVIPVINHKASRTQSGVLSGALEEMRLPYRAPTIELGNGLTRDEVYVQLDREIDLAINRKDPTVLMIDAGDGTVNTIVQHVYYHVGSQSSIIFAHVASGQCNVNGLEYGIRPDQQSIVRALRSENVKRIDYQNATFMAEDGHMLPSRRGLLAVGVVAASAIRTYERVRAGSTRKMGLTERIMRSVPESVNTVHPTAIKVSDRSGVIYEQQSALGEVLNGAGYMFLVPATGNVTDGTMTMMLVPARDKFQVLTQVTFGLLLAHMGIRKHNPFMQQFQSNQFTFELGEPSDYHVDGEVGETKVRSVSIVSVPQAIPFLVMPEQVVSEEV